MKRIIAICLLLLLFFGSVISPIALATEADMPIETPYVEDNTITDDIIFDDDADDMDDFPIDDPVQWDPIVPRSDFSQAEMSDPDMWYTTPDNTITLTASSTAYGDLLKEIRNAPANTITHIIIPFHINTGNISGDGSLVTLRSGATVVLIGAHPTAEGGQSVISDTHEGSAVSRTFRVRGDGGERTALVLRNIILQKAPRNGQSMPVTPPTPNAMHQQRGTSMGGGIAIEQNGGGGHVILCRDAVIRHSSTGNEGTVDIQGDSKFTMMPGSLMHNNVAGNSGGAVNVGLRATFVMYGGTIRNNLARGDTANRLSTILENGMRANGGGVFIHQGGTFYMYDGEIYENIARLGFGIPLPGVNTTNTIVSSNGGGVFVTGSNSSFHMYGGTIRDNEAIRTTTSLLSTANTIAAINNRNAYRSGNGGGVYLTGGATFYMYGGEITDNFISNTGATTNSNSAINGINLSRGGGVYLTGNNTRFIMHGGEITRNQVVQTVSGAFRGGGGVAIDAGAVFEMHAGEITKNIAIAMQSQNYQGGGGVLVGGNMAGVGTSTFLMYGGTISENRATYAGNADTGPGEGGGVLVTPFGDFTMYSGAITYNFARSNGRGGGGVFVAGGRFTTANLGAVTEKTISYNQARGHGGGIGVQRVEVGQFTNGIAGEARISEGTIVAHNEAGIANDFVTDAGLAGGILVLDDATLFIDGGEIRDNTSLRGGGGIAVLGSSTVRMSGGEITDNFARSDISTHVDRGRGGGVYVTQGSQFHATAGSITHNTANEGGGLFVPHSNLNNISIGQAFVFSDNVAHTGMQLDNTTAEQYRDRIHPDTVSVDMPIIDQVPPGSNQFVYIAAHAFSNHDINATGPQFFRVTYEVGEGEGNIDVHVGQNELPVKSGSLVPIGTTLYFEASPTAQFLNWDIGFQMGGTTGDEYPEFFFYDGGTHPSLSHTVYSNTHIIGNFREMLSTLSVSKEVTGAQGNQHMNFDFTIFFTDVNGDSLPEGSTFELYGDTQNGTNVTAPADGMLTLDDKGSANFSLSHGQIIHIQDVPLGIYIQIVETAIVSYDVSFVDSIQEDVTVRGNDTGVLSMTENRALAFINAHIFVPPTGLHLPHLSFLLFPMFITFGAFAYFVFHVSYRHKKGR